MNSSTVIGDLLGSGSNSRVYEIVDQDGCEFCLKIVHQESLSEISVRSRYENYTNFLKRIDHPFFSRIFAVQSIEDRNMFMIVCEKHECSLSELMDRFPEIELSQVRRIASQILVAIDYLRRKKEVFSGIHPSKIMIKKNGWICLNEPNYLSYKKRDISAAHLTSDIEKYLRTFTFLSPELTQGGKKLDHSSDLWSLGVLIFWMISNKRIPFRCETPFLLFPRIRDQIIEWGDEESISPTSPLDDFSTPGDEEEEEENGEGGTEKKNISRNNKYNNSSHKKRRSTFFWDPDAKEVIMKLLRFERDQRIGYGNNMKKLLSHPFFKEEVKRIRRELRNLKNSKLQVIKDQRERASYLFKSCFFKSSSTFSSSSSSLLQSSTSSDVENKAEGEKKRDLQSVGGEEENGLGMNENHDDGDVFCIRILLSNRKQCKVLKSPRHILYMG